VRALCATALFLPDNSIWNKPCTCTSVSGGTVVQRSTVGPTFNGCYESFENLLSGWIGMMEDGCGRDTLE
jgi:hypothetical protein